eukprot:6774160-Alexandrium_andersonii.AAC.1
MCIRDRARTSPAVPSVAQGAEVAAAVQAELDGKAALLQVLRRRVPGEERPAAAPLALEAKVREGR